MKNVAVLLAGSGVFDGAEVNEAVLTLLHISKQGASYQCFAPDTQQTQVINHLSGEESSEKRKQTLQCTLRESVCVPAYNSISQMLD